MIPSNDPEIGSNVVANGIGTNYLEAGEGSPLILVHGSGPGVTAYANWRLVIPKLASHFRVIALDMAGFGYTERPQDADYSMEFWLAHLSGFLDALGIQRASFVGNSFGGALTLAFAAQYPDRVDRFVLMGSAGVEFTLTSALDAVWGYEPSEESMAHLMNLFAYDKSLLSPELIQSRYKASIRPGYQESYRLLFPGPRQRHVSRLATPEEAIARIDKRVLLLHGRDDVVVPPTTSHRLVQLIPRSELHLFGQCGHWVQVEKCGPFCELVTRFLKGNLD
ncbi:alpha/beta hydrolase [Magnetospirillum sp. 15-1]|uniref:alpha/beta fold hydrolase n=1 Tax=Magnetospirillum sp. 15-1 TaxID=1979370 RepID=UPI000BBBA535|nr:alpha/beta hydrolase [Magnetospirillum sp. 15-1]